MVGALVVEVVGVLIWLVALFVAWKLEKMDFLVYVTVFAVVFENVALILFPDSNLGYFYSEKFLLYIFEVPLFVVLSWGVLIFGGYLLALRLKMSKLSRTFFIPLFVVMIDFVIEGIAVDLGYWTWKGFGEGVNVFSSVSPSNFVGWLGLVFGFLVCYEFLERKWLSMFLGYFVFLGVAVLFVSFSRIFGLPDNNYFSFILVTLIFLICFLYFYHRDSNVGRKIFGEGSNFMYVGWVVWLRGLFYLFAGYWFVVRGFYLDVVYDLVLVCVLGLEVYFGLRFYGVLGKKI